MQLIMGTILKEPLPSVTYLNLRNNPPIWFEDKNNFELFTSWISAQSNLSEIVLQENGLGVWQFNRILKALNSNLTILDLSSIGLPADMFK